MFIPLVYYFAFMQKETILVTSALPYANGPIHFGHIAGAYLPADIFVRFNKLLKNDVVYVCGTDEHGFAITVSAQQEGNSPQAHVDHYFKVICEIFEKFNIEFDNFSRTTLKHHYDLSQDFFLQLYNKNKIEEKQTDQLYCESCCIFLADRYVTGTCQHCNYDEARGDECPKCGQWIEATELIDPLCKVCGNKPVVRQTKHWFLKLGEFSRDLKDWIASKKNWKPNVTNFINGMIGQGLESRPITRDMDWGIPVPLAEAENKVLYVWFDAPIGYISSTIEWARKQGDPDLWKKYWHNPDCRLVHFIGKDNLPFHCVTWPAVLMGQDAPFILPTDVPANEFYNLEGKQFSKSTGWYIDLEDFFNKYQADSIRFTIAANAPETKDSAFSWKEFQNRHNGELADILGNFVMRTLKFAESYFDNKVPGRKKASNVDRQFLEKIENSITLLEELFNTYQVRRACFEIMEMARAGNRYFDEKAPWKSRKEDMEDCSVTLNCSLQLVKALAQVCFPVMPETSQSIWEMLNLQGKMEDKDWNLEKTQFLQEGHGLGKAKVLFTKIEDKDIDQEIRKLKKMVDKKEDNAAREDKRAAPMITFDRFKDIQLKVAEILAAEPVEHSRKLMRLDISLGSEQRQIVAGIKEHYPDPATLVGRKIVVVANLEPAKLMGLESRGMLLAAQSGDGLFLISPDEGAPAGAEVS
ncbi:methionine--tRNA ligase [Fibrobacterota bacterium]